MTVSKAVADLGEGVREVPPPLVLVQTDARRVEKFFFGETDLITVSEAILTGR